MHSRTLSYQKWVDNWQQEDVIQFYKNIRCRATVALVNKQIPTEELLADSNFVAFCLDTRQS